MCASFLILGFWIDRIDFVGSFGLMCLMIGALYSHIKVGDTFKKYMPATQSTVDNVTEEANTTSENGVEMPF